MKKVINSPDKVVEDMVQGILKTHSDDIRTSNDSNKVLCRKTQIKDKVGIVIGGGSGHEPLFFGLLGENLADSVAIGDVFAAPSPKTILDAIKEADQGNGVICLFGNYAGDVLNFNMGKELAEFEGITVHNFPITDDVASAPKEKRQERRGIAGDLFVIKEVCAAASNGASLEECREVAEKSNLSTYSIGVGIKPGINPVTGHPNFELNENEIEFGLGIHGEPGIKTIEHTDAKSLVNEMYRYLKGTIEHETNDIVLGINGLGSTTMMELYIITEEITSLLNEEGLNIKHTFVGSLCTTQEMAGFSITIHFLDEELEKLYHKEAVGVHYYHRGKKYG